MGGMHVLLPAWCRVSPTWREGNTEKLILSS